MERFTSVQHRVAPPTNNIALQAPSREEWRNQILEIAHAVRGNISNASQVQIDVLHRGATHRLTVVRLDPIQLIRVRPSEELARAWDGIKV